MSITSGIGNLSQEDARSNKNEKEEWMTDGDEGARNEKPEILTATDGAGPLLQRDYWAIIEGSRLTPPQVMEKILSEFPSFSPEDLARFWYPEGVTPPLKIGDEMQVVIKGAGESAVRVTQLDDQSMTMRTLESHPESGRITFGAYWDRAGRLKFRIRSVARASDLVRLIGYQLFGKGLQSGVWTTFIERVAEACGGRIHGEVHVEEKSVEESLADRGDLETPTFAAADREE
jgi:hypothetical protein